jgi:hypothetical protein
MDQPAGSLHKQLDKLAHQELYYLLLEYLLLLVAGDVKPFGSQKRISDCPAISNDKRLLEQKNCHLKDIRRKDKLSLQAAENKQKALMDLKKSEKEKGSQNWTADRPLFSKPAGPMQLQSKSHWQCLPTIPGMNRASWFEEFVRPRVLDFFK